MRLTEKTEVNFRRIEEIISYSFKGVERPPAMALRYEFDNGEVFVLYDGTRTGSPIAAFAIVNRDGGQPYLWALATTPAYRKTGYGSRLLTEVINWCWEQHAERLELSVSVNNPAQKLYFDHGFRVIRVLPRFYGEVNGLRMRRSL